MTKHAKGALFALLLVFSTALSAFSGHITANTVWSSDVTITGDVYIDAGITLTIDPGVTVSFTKVDQNTDTIGDTDFFVDGRLLTLGTAAQPVIFTSNEASPAANDWAGIDFRNTGSVHSSLAYAQILYAWEAVNVEAKYIDISHCMIAYAGTYGMLVNNSYDGLVSIDGLTVYENGTYGVRVNAAGKINATNLISSSNATIGIWTVGTTSAIFGSSRSVSNGQEGVYISGAAPQFTNCDISSNGESGVVVETSTSNPTFTTCTISQNEDFGMEWANGCTGSVTYTEVINNAHAGFWVTSNTYPVINYCNIYGNGADTTALYLTEAIPSSSLYLTSSGTSSNYTLLMPMDKISQIHVSGYADHDSYSDDYTFSVCNGVGTVLYSYDNSNNSNDTSFNTWANVNNNTTNMQMYVTLYVYSVYSPYGRVTEVKYNIGNLPYQLATINTSSVINAGYNWWGQVNGVDGLVYRTVAGTVSYEGLQTAPVTTAGATLPDVAPTFYLTTPASMVINPTSLAIQWYDVDVDDNATIDLYYDTDHDTTGTLIAAGLSEDSVTDSYTWSFADTPHDIYYIYGVIDDGVNEPIVSYAPGRVQVGPLSAGMPDDAHGEAGESIQIPVEIVNSWSYYGIISFQFTLNYDLTLLTATGVTTAGTLSDSWTVNYNNAFPGQIQVNGFTTAPLETDGTLLYINFNVAGEMADYTTCALTFSEWTFNDGSATVVQDNGAFSVLNRYEITGMVDYYTNGEPIMGAQLDLTGREEDTVATNVAGDFEFDPHLAGNYVLTPSCGIVVPELTVTPYDASLTARYALGLVTFNNNQELAADVNADDTPTVYDAALIAQYSVGLITSFEAGAWAFDPESSTFELVGYPAVKEFLAIAIGDPSGNYSPSRALPQAWAVPAPQRVDGDNVALVLHCDEAFYSFLASVTFDPQAVEFVQARLGDNLDGFQLTSNVDGNVLRVGAFGTQAATAPQGAAELVFRVLDESLLESAFNMQYLLFDETTCGYVQTVATQGGTLVPMRTALAQNWPNPFNPVTTIAYSLAAPQQVTLEVFNVRGQLVTTLVNERQETGSYSLVWNADGQASGVYFYRLRTGDTVDVKKMLLLK